MTLQKQLEYVHQEVLVDTQWKEDHLDDPKVRIAEVDYDSSSKIEMKKKRIKKTSTVFFIVVTALFAVTLIPSSQQASAVVHHKVAVHHIAHTAIIPETHGKLLNATALKKLVKGPYGESDVIGGMIVGGERGVLGG
jgi:hypothetical protein